MMGGRPYQRNPGINPSLEDMIQAAVSGAPVATSPAVSGPQDQMDQQQSELLRMLTTPESQGNAPVVEEKPWWAKMLMGMGDAYSAYGATLAGGSPGESSFSKYLRSQERAKANLTEWQRKTSESKRDADLRGATFLYGEKQRKDEKALADAAKKEANAYRDQKDKAEAVQHQADKAQALAIETDRIAAQERMNTLDNTTREHAAAMQLKLAGLKKTEEADTEQHAEYKKVRMWAVANKGDILAKVKSGELTPDQVRETIQGMLEASDLVGPYLEAASAFLANQIGVGLERHEFAQTYENQGPEKLGNYPVPSGAATLQRRPVGGGI